MSNHQYSTGDRVRSLINYGSFGTMRIKRKQVVEVVEAGEHFVVVSDNGESHICFLRREVEPLPLLRSQITGGGKRFWRVSAFPLDFADIRQECAVHKASRRADSAEGHFLDLCRHLGTKYGAVILHQGNLKWRSYKIYARRDAAAGVAA